MKKVIIPSSSNPFVVDINGKKYTYQAGTEQEVPDEVAVIIEAYYEHHTAKPEETTPPFSCCSGGGGTGGSASAKVFDFTLEDGAKLKITDLGSDIVNVCFCFTGNRTGADLQYELPADNAEFAAWANGKALMFQTMPIVDVGGINAGTFFDSPALAMLDVSGAFYGAPSMILYATGYQSDSVERIIFNETVRILSLAEFG